MTCAQSLGSVTSSWSHFPPLWTISATRVGVRDGWRDVAITVWCGLWDWMQRVRARPMPEEQPVMSHVRGLWGMVNVVDMVVFFCTGGLDRVNLCWRDCPC